MAVHTLVKKDGIYFITFTCYKWLPLIEQTKAYDEVYKFFTVLNKNGHTVLGYVIMPNHLHFLLYYQHGAQSLNTVIGNGKRFIGYEIIKRLQQQQNDATLLLLQNGVNPAEKQRDKLHQIWQGTFDIKECRTEKFILQKLNYMHQNPCTGKWKLSLSPHHYEHSSALFYERGKPIKFAVKDYRDFLALLLEQENEWEQNR